MENYEEFKADIFRLIKLDLNAYKEKQMRRRIETLAEKLECETFREYFLKLKADKAIFDEFINFMTINVSEFYRNLDQWKILHETNIPTLIDRFGKPLRVWSAACSTGDEPYSLVMALSRHMDLKNIRIYATDIDKQVIAQAKTGLYSAKSIVNVPDDFKEKYFEPVGESFKISDDIKRRVEFHEHNLLRDSYPHGYHLIVCRNVLIYFTEEAKRDIYTKFHAALSKGGLLFIGSTEQVADYKEIGFKRLSSFFYEKI